MDKVSKTNQSKEFELIAAEIELQKTEVENIKSYIQTDDKRNHTSNEDILQQLDDLRTALDEKKKLLQTANVENFLLESRNDQLDENIIRLKAMLEKKDEEIMKLRHKIKKFDKLREDMLLETRKTREELTVKMDKVTEDSDFMRGQLKIVHSAMQELLTGSRKENIEKKRNGWNNSQSTRNAQNARNAQNTKKNQNGWTNSSSTRQAKTAKQKTT